MRFITKPKVIDAFQWGVDEPPVWWSLILGKGHAARMGSSGRYVYIKTPRGKIYVAEGEWIIKDKDGEFSVLEDDEFRDRYDQN